MDYLQFVASATTSQRSGDEVAEASAFTLMADAKMRIAVYDDKAVIAALNHFQTHGELASPAGVKSYLEVVAEMRNANWPDRSQAPLLVRTDLQAVARSRLWRRPSAAPRLARAPRQHRMTTRPQSPRIEIRPPNTHTGSETSRYTLVHAANHDPRVFDDT